ncbi:MAG: argininosuccinate lyase [Phycisphaerales bacterium]|nr:argininosuccinate lyase [Phycisphaerales bacterium]
MSLWGGRFEGESLPLFKRFNDSLPFDCRLLEADVEGSVAWAAALADAGVLSPADAARLQQALREVAGVGLRDLSFVAGSGDEDIHSWVETRLIELVGDLGKRLHTGRSRNDQVATDLRIFARTEANQRIAEIKAAIAALAAFARRELGVVAPGMTHLQHGQPVLLSHWALAYAEMLRRDAGRFADAIDRSDECPLGSGALAGTAYPIDRQRLAESLGFARPTANSLDAVSDRDFVLELLSASAICAVHLSRIAEDLIVYSSAEFRLVEMSDQVTSGSSLMPQKKNPDAAELLRGKCGRICGGLVSLLMTVKGLPLAYNKDLQEDKEPLFDAMEHLSLCLQVLVPIVDGLLVDRERCRASAARGYSNATELADYLVGRGVPFRDAHETVGRAVRRAIELDVPLESMPLRELKALDDRIEPDVGEWLRLEHAIERRDVVGGTATRRVEDAIEAIDTWLGACTA